MKLEIDIKNMENIGDLTPEKISRIVEIYEALVVSGGLTGVKAGRTIIHFDAEGVFQGIELSYFPWKRRRLST